MHACEVWSLLGSQKALTEMQLIESRSFRMLLALPQQTSTKLLYAEWGRLPLSHSWVQQCLKYVDRMISLGDDRLCKLAFLRDKESGLGWNLNLADMLRKAGICMPRDRQPEDLDCKELASKYKDHTILQHSENALFPEVPSK